MQKEAWVSYTCQSHQKQDNGSSKLAHFSIKLCFNAGYLHIFTVNVTVWINALMPLFVARVSGGTFSADHFEQ